MRHPSHSKLRTRAIHSPTHSPAPTAHTSLPTPARPLAQATRYCARWTRATASPWAGRTARAGRRGAGPLRRGALERADGRAGAARAWRRDGGRQCRAAGQMQARRVGVAAGQVRGTRNTGRRARAVEGAYIKTTCSGTALKCGCVQLRIDRLRARTSSSIVSVAGSRVSTTRGHWPSSISRGSPLQPERRPSPGCVLHRCS
jgi:hypothetical protein